MTLPVFDLPQIAAVTSKPLIFGAVREALMAHAEGRPRYHRRFIWDFPMPTATVTSKRATWQARRTLR